MSSEPLPVEDRQVIIEALASALVEAYREQVGQESGGDEECAEPDGCDAEYTSN